MSDYNYYKVGGSLEYQHPTYVVRQADDELYEGLHNGEFCYVLNSRQMGKSSLRVQMMKKLKEQGRKCASIDMTRIGSHVTPSEWYAGVISELLRGFGLSKKVDFSTWWRQRELLPPLQRLRELIEDVLLVEFSQNLVIFIDEIDSIIKIKFKEDFFAFIRACYNQRVDNPDYNRLTFCLLGVATPSDLIEDKNISTPFNIGRAIELTGFQLHEATPLAQGLTEKTSNPQAILREVLAWTGGQPFLTQKVCKLILSASQPIPDGGEAAWIENLVRSRIIEHWETQDEPEHLRTIRDRLIWSQRKEQLLQLYRHLQTGEIKAHDKPEHMELRLSGLVVKQHDKLRVYNRIYGSIFNQSWVENALAEASLLLEVAETPALSDNEIQAIEQAGIRALQLFEFGNIKALLKAMQAGQALQALVKDGHPLKDYPAVSPMLALQKILDNIHERNQFKSNQGMAYGVCFSRDGRYITTAGSDGTLRIWNLFGQQIAGWRGHQSIVYGVSFSPDGQLIATAGADATARLWNLSGQQIAQFDGHQGSVWSVNFSPDGQMIATAGDDCTARLWNLSQQQITQFDNHQGQVWYVSFSPDGQRIATAGADSTARLWNLSGQQLAQLNGHQDWVRLVIFSPDGQYLATGGYDSTARLWNLSGQQLAQLNNHPGAVLGMSFSPDGQCLVTAGADGTLRLWDLSQKHLPQLKGHRGKVWSVSFSPDGQLIASAGRDGTARLWNLSGQQLAQLKGHQGQVWSVSFSPNGDYLVTTGSDKTARLWNLSGQELAQFYGHQGWVTRVTFSPNGQRLATVGRDGTARLWDLSGQLISQVIPQQGWVWSVSFSPDGQLVATVGLDAKPPILDLSGRLIVQLKDYPGAIASTSFSPDGQYLVTASLEDGTARLWNVFGQQLAQLDGHQGWVICVSFSPNGQLIATGGEDGTVCLWDLSGRQIAEFNSNQDVIYGMSFSPNGESIATAGKDGTVRLWRVEGLDELLARGCNWLNDYFVAHPEALEKLGVCQKRSSCIEGGKNLARADDVEGALGKAIPQEILESQKPPELTSPLDSGSKAELRKLTAKALVAVVGEMLTRQGDIEKAVAAYAEAQRLDPTIEIPTVVGNNLCRWGSLWGHAAEVMEACETAVALEPENRKFRDSRGLARALTGNIAGAIEDFQAFVDWTDNQEKKLQRQGWIDALRAGENPFNEEEIERLFNEYVVAHPEVLEELEVCQNQLSCVEEDRNLGGVGEVEDAIHAYVPVVPDELTSDSGIDYTRLRDFLAEEHWKEADRETTAIMLRISCREAEGWLREEDIEKFPCTDLLTIDQLWVKYSQGRFGFSVQKGIWQSVSFALRLEECNGQSCSPTTVAKRRFVTTTSKESGEGFLGEFSVHDKFKLVRIYHGDITSLGPDVIVSSDDNHLTMGGGVSQRIRQVGGDAIYWEARNLIPLSLGEVAVTTAGELRAKKIFHSVVIDFEDREGPSSEVIQRVVHTCMKKASIYRFCSIAFPLLGTGAGGFPVKVAWKILLKQIIRDLSDETQNLISVIIVLYDKKIVEELKVKSFLERIEKFGWRSLL